MDWKQIGYVVLFVAMLLAILFFSSLSFRRENDGLNFCLAHGYPEYSSVNYLSPQYCIKRVNQTDVVTPFEELR